MQEINNQKLVSVKELSDILNVSDDTILRAIKHLRSSEEVAGTCKLGIVVRNGIPTMLNELQCTAIKKHIQGHHNLKDTNTIKTVSTELDGVILVRQAMDYLNYKIESLELENKKLADTNSRLMFVNRTYTATEIAKELGLRSAADLNAILEANKIQFKVNNTWELYADYSSLGYVSIKQEILDNGKVVYNRHFTQAGREWVLGLFEKKLVIN